MNSIVFICLYGYKAQYEISAALSVGVYSIKKSARITKTHKITCASDCSIACRYIFLTFTHSLVSVFRRLWSDLSQNCVNLGKSWVDLHIKVNQIASNISEFYTTLVKITLVMGDLFLPSNCHLRLEYKIIESILILWLQFHLGWVIGIASRFRIHILIVMSR